MSQRVGDVRAKASVCWSDWTPACDADTSRDVFRHAQIGTGTVAFAEIAKLLRDANLGSPTILEVVDEDAQSAIDASVEYLDRVHWPTG